MKFNGTIAQFPDNLEFCQPNPCKGVQGFSNLLSLKAKHAHFLPSAPKPVHVAQKRSRYDSQAVSVTGWVATPLELLIFGTHLAPTHGIPKTMEDVISHHLNALGQSQSNQYPNLAPDEIVLSFKEPAAMEALHVYAELTEDDDLAVAIRKRLDAIGEELKRQVGTWAGSKNARV